jgi:hypothetical protein
LLICCCFSFLAQVLGSIFLNFLSVPAIVWTLKKVCCKFDRPCTTVILEDIVVRTGLCCRSGLLVCMRRVGFSADVVRC